MMLRDEGGPGDLRCGGDPPWPIAAL